MTESRRSFTTATPPSAWTSAPTTISCSTPPVGSPAAPGGDTIVSGFYARAEGGPGDDAIGGGEITGGPGADTFFSSQGCPDESFFEAVYLNYVPRDLDALGEALLIAGANIDLTAAA